MLKDYFCEICGKPAVDIMSLGGDDIDERTALSGYKSGAHKREDPVGNRIFVHLDCISDAPAYWIYPTPQIQRADAEVSNG